MVLSQSTGPNTANNEWTFDQGLIRLKSNPTLCITGPDAPFDSLSPPAVLALCNASSVAQQFTITNSSQYPFATISQGSFVLGTQNQDTSPASAIVFTPTVGTFITGCNSGSQAQHITYTGNSSAPGQLQALNNMCVSGACDDFSSGCAPLQLVECDASDRLQLFYYTTTNSSFENVVTGLCLDAWNNQVTFRLTDMSILVRIYVSCLTCLSIGSTSWGFCLSRWKQSRMDHIWQQYS
jgi:hypothetical protein